MLDEAVGEDRALRVLLIVVLVAAIVGGAIDLVMDAPESWLSLHVAYEVLLILTGMLTAWLFWRGWYRTRRSLAATRGLLALREADRDAWRERAQHALSGLATAIDQQFHAWQLTPAEREIALLLLKGHSHKQIAFATSRSERTVRQHAVAVYDKSGLGGRAELAAFFLEDLMLPTETTDP